MSSSEGAILYRARFLLPISSVPLEDAALLVDGGKIVAVDSFDRLAAVHPGVAVVDFGESILLPPMVNAHTHLELSSFEQWADAAGEPDAPKTFVDWILWLVRVRRHVSEEQLHSSLAAGLKASLLAGTGAVGDILTTLSAASAYRSSPLSGRLFAEVLGHDSGLVAGRLAAISSAIDNGFGTSVDWGLSPHAPYSLSSESMDLVFAYAERMALQCSMHLAESSDETRFLQNGSGAIAEKLYAAANWDPLASSPPACSPVASLCRQGRLKSGDLVIHGVQVDAADIEQLNQVGCSVVLCPRSNAALNVGKAPVAAYLKAGVPLALGTDSLASAQSLSLWDEIAFAMGWLPGEAKPCYWLEMATLGGAKALGLQGRMGQLAPGFDASFQVVTLPRNVSVHDLEEALCLAGKDVEVTHLYLAAQNVLPQE